MTGHREGSVAMVLVTDVPGKVPTEALGRNTKWAETKEANSTQHGD